MEKYSYYFDLHLNFGCDYDNNFDDEGQDDPYDDGYERLEGEAVPEDWDLQGVAEPPEDSCDYDNTTEIEE